MSSRNRIQRAFGIDASEHGRHEAIVPDESINIQVINLGLSRTGTTSVNEALEILGFGPGHQGVDLYRFPEQRKAFTELFRDLSKGTAGPPEVTAARLRRITRGYRSAGDGPMNNFPELSLLAYPDAKYLLCTRDGGKKAWWKSFDDTLGWHFRKDFSRSLFRFLIYPVSLLRTQDDAAHAYGKKLEADTGIDIGPDTYDRHNERVRRLVPKDRLLEYNVKQGWAPLCKFLEVPVPDRPFPRLNETESMKKIYFGMQAFGATVWCIYLFGIVGAVYLAALPSFAEEVGNRVRGTTRFVQSFFR